MTAIVLDISRLLSRVRHSTPSGVDRVEMAYARGLLDAHGRKLAFGAVHPTGVYGRIPYDTALAYLDLLESRWAESERQPQQLSLPAVLPWMKRLLPTARGVGSARVLVQVSPHHLHHPQKVQRKLSREGARFVCMVHDLIPIEFPEYARPGGAALHARRMDTVARYANAVIVNSTATGASLTRWIDAHGLDVPPIHVALLGTEALASSPPQKDPQDKPFFVCVGTIEPRKNHLLLLHLWRRMAESLPPERVPRLVVIGRRGWENEQILDLLDRCPAIAPFVTEIRRCGDRELAGWIRGARALLMPSFTEGYGMPIAEALSVGTPVIASDIPAHREVGGNVPDYRDALNGPAWQEAILDHAQDGPLHRAQVSRLNGFQAPDWRAHMAIATQVIEEVAR